MEIIRGDLIQLIKSGTFNLIIHGCNCQSQFRSGFAKQLKEAFPETYETDRNDDRTPEEKLGNYTHTKIYIKKKPIWIINAYTQFDESNPDKVTVDYNAMYNVFQKIALSYSQSFDIAYPKIGAGVAKGNWNLIKVILDDAFKYHNHAAVLLPTVGDFSYDD